MAYNIGAKIQLEGEKEYRQQIESIKKSQAELESQTKRLTAEFEDNANSVDYLTKKQEILNSQSDKNREKIDAITDRLDALGKEYRKNAERIDEYRKAVAQTEESLEAMRKSGDASEEALHEQENTLLNLEKALSGAERAQRKMSDSMTQLRTQLNDAETASIRTEREIRNVAKALEESSDEGEAFGDNIKDSFGSAGEVVGGFGGQLLDIMENFSKARDSGVTASDAMSAALTAGLIPAVVDLVAELKNAQAEYDKMRMDAEESLTKAKLSLGLTEEETAELAKGIERIYQEGVVDSREEATEAMTVVRRLLEETGEQAEQTARSAIAIKETFGNDYSETIKTASTIMKTFGTDSEEAFNLITNGLQSSANRSGDLLDVLNEYSNSFERIGYSSNEFLSGLIASADAGAYSIDKAADSIKEFYNGAVDASDDYREALEALGLNAEKTTEQIVSGGESGKNALQEVLKRLGSMTNETKQAQTAAKLFGSQWEDVGTEAILAFSESTKSAKRFTTETGDLIRELGTTTETWSNRMKRGFESIGPAIVNSLLGPLGTLTSMQTKIAEMLSGISRLGNGSSGLFGKGFASGTPSADPGIHPVAEEGPELVTRPSFRSFSGGERVYTAGETQRILQSTASGSTVYNLYITADISQLDDVKQLVESAKRQQLNARSR